MKLLYLECSMGAAGDMLMGALYELLDDRQKDVFLAQMSCLAPCGISITPAPDVKCQVQGTRMHVTVYGQEETVHAHTDTSETAHTHTGLSELLARIDALPLPEQVKQNASAVYRKLGEAESAVHGVPVDQIHFHEVGSLDAMADVIGCCLLLDLLVPDRICASPVCVGSGTVSCAHGILPVPAPATAILLAGIPIYGGEIAGELCTPTGAALLSHFVQEYSGMPLMRIVRTGYGMGTKEFPRANCVRAFLGAEGSKADGFKADASKADNSNADASKADGGTWEQIAELSCSLDDITGENLSFAAETLLAAGALDVYLTPVYMKKGRPGHLLTCLCRCPDAERLMRLIFLHTTTRGVRILEYDRQVLSTQFWTAETPDGPVRVKRSEGSGICKEKAEYEDLARIARCKGCSLEQVREVLPCQHSEREEG